MKVVRQKLGCKVDVAEIYSPPRVVSAAKQFRSRPEFSLDFTSPPQGRMEMGFQFGKLSQRGHAAHQ